MSIWALGITWALGLWLLRGRTMQALERHFASAALEIDRRHLGMPVVFVLALTLGAVPWMLGAVSPPIIHDEFAYLLGADTFAHGRLTNPTPPFSEHFETFHVIMHPTYQSKFPPGQSLALAAGQVLGDPLFGAFGAVAAGCAAGYWMLRAVLPPRWAMVGALFSILQPLTYSWGQNYWGGGVPLIGGMLFAGAILRLRTRNSPAACLMLGIAVAIFLNTRIAEGGIVTVLGLGWLAYQRICRRGASGLLRMAIISTIPLLPTLAWMGYYNWRITGNAMELPYMLHTRQYMQAPIFRWQSPLPEKTYVHDRLRRFHAVAEVQEWRRNADHILQSTWTRIQDSVKGWFDVLWIPMLPVLPALLRGNRAARLSLWMLAGFIAIQAGISLYFRPHYTAPVMPFALLLMSLSLRQWHRAADRWAGLGPAVMRTIILTQALLLATVAIHLAEKPARIAESRPKIIQDLQNKGGKHLVLVDYLPGPSPLFEWVFNSHDIDSQTVIWARSLGAEKDAALLKHYASRSHWRLTVKQLDLQLSPISSAPVSQPSPPASTAAPHEADGTSAHDSALPQSTKWMQIPVSSHLDRTQ